jgi:hypothetical protein
VTVSKNYIISYYLFYPMIKQILLLFLLILLVCNVSAANANVSVMVDTTIVNSTFLDVNIWMLILIIGLVCMFLSHIPGWDKSNPIWACLSPFFTFAAAWFSTSLQYTYTNAFNLGDGTYGMILEHNIYHLDWIATGLLGIVFIFSCLNVAYVLSGRSIQKPNRDEIHTRNARQESMSDE